MSLNKTADMDQSRRGFRILNSVLLLVLTSFILLGALWERIPIEDGLGWDGKVYGDIAMNFPDYVLNKKFGSYTIPRILPSAIVWTTCRSLGIELNVPNVINSFLVLNCFCIYLGFYYFDKISEHLRFSRRAHIMAFASLFLSYPILKLSSYYPVLTDVPAFCAGIATLYFYLKSRTISLVLAVLLGSFIFPTMLYIGLLLLMYPRKPIEAVNPKSKTTTKAIGLSLAGLYLAYVIYVFYLRSGLEKMNLTTEWAQINEPFFPVTILLVAAYLYLCAVKTIEHDGYLMLPFKNLMRLRLTLPLVLFIAVKLVYMYLDNHQPSMGLKDFAFQSVRLSVAEPLIFLVSRTLYFGPFLLLIALFHKAFFGKMREWGVGMVLFVLGYLVIGIGSESRQYINAMPVFYLMVCAVLNDLKIENRHVAFAAVSQLIFSRFWYHINVESFTGKYTEFPFQHYFMVHGPWMSHQMYLVQGGVVLVTCTVMYFVFRDARQVSVAHE